MRNALPILAVTATCAAFAWLCYVAQHHKPMQSSAYVPAKPVILHHAEDAPTRKAGESLISSDKHPPRHTYRTMNQLLAAVELERRQDAAYAELYGAGR